MKTAYVSDLTPDTTITSFFLVCEKELRSTREGKPFLRLELSDRSGTIEARLWDNVDAFAALFDRDDMIRAADEAGIAIQAFAPAQDTLPAQKSGSERKS